MAQQVKALRRHQACEAMFDSQDRMEERTDYHKSSCDLHLRTVGIHTYSHIYKIKVFFFKGIETGGCPFSDQWSP